MECRKTQTVVLTDTYIINKSSTEELKSLKFKYPGVYILHDSNNVTSAKNVYVGKSKNIIQRISNHSVKLPNVTYLAFFEEQSQGVIDALEDVMIKIVSHFSKLYEYQLLNSEQIKENIDTLLVKSEYDTLVKAAKSMSNELFFAQVNVCELENICKQHKKESRSSLLDLINLGVIRGYAAPSIYSKAYCSLTDNYYINLWESQHNIDIEWGDERYCEANVRKGFMKYYVFLGTQELINMQLSNKYSINKDSEITYVHVGNPKDIVVNGSETCNFMFLDIKQWTKQQFTEDDFIGDGWEYADTIDKLDIFPRSLEEFMQR